MSTTLRGNNKIFKDFFQPAIEQETTQQKKGRNVELNTKRNECLIERYYYYGSITQDRYETIIEKLSVEFFLSKVTIPKIIDDNYGLLASKKQEYKELSTDKLKRKLAKKWPHLTW